MLKSQENLQHYTILIGEGNPVYMWAPAVQTHVQGSSVHDFYLRSFSKRFSPFYIRCE